VAEGRFWLGVVVKYSSAPVPPPASKGQLVNTQQIDVTGAQSWSDGVRLRRFRGVNTNMARSRYHNNMAAMGGSRVVVVLRRPSLCPGNDERRFEEKSESCLW
jgi:hypothetical protein